MRNEQVNNELNGRVGNIDNHTDNIFVASFVVEKKFYYGCFGFGLCPTPVGSVGKFRAYRMPEGGAVLYCTILYNIVQ